MPSIRGWAPNDAPEGAASAEEDATARQAEMAGRARGIGRETAGLDARVTARAGIGRRAAVHGRAAVDGRAAVHTGVGRRWRREAVHGQVGLRASKAELAATAGVVALAPDGRARMTGRGVVGQGRLDGAGRVARVVEAADEVEVARATGNIAATEAVTAVGRERAAVVDAARVLRIWTMRRRRPGRLEGTDQVGRERITASVPLTVVVARALIAIVVTVEAAAGRLTTRDVREQAALVVVAGSEAVLIRRVDQAVAVVVDAVTA